MTHLPNQKDPQTVYSVNGRAVSAAEFNQFVKKLGIFGLFTGGQTDSESMFGVAKSS